MNHKIALFADVHGNTTALKAVIEDSILEKVTDYWFLGDLIMPGPGSADLLALLKSINVSVYVKGNWEDCLLEALAGEVDLNDSSDIYIARLAQYQCETLNNAQIEMIKRLPLHATKTINGLNISIAHNLPDKNYGGDLVPDQTQQNFDRLFTQPQSDVAIYAHVHHQMLRYSSEDQLIINPGSVGQPYFKWAKHRCDRRAQYAIFEIDEQGVAQVSFRKVGYDVNKELQEAKRHTIPYLTLYKEQLETGKTHTHDKDFLKEINQRYGYEKDVREFLTSLDLDG
ncbi:metallophosphoesterase family protein [Sporolactobacillus shoreicorticis]|uniref:Metallophosphoesterase family protein n=1 Tax=Sporolactobacillus shoreicorticis TaxID=1923877 RepID=A0ABW5S265_9BACL|nr:metallophosphoesterase family protein [Sporolactobacillus shoreicorticis]MCO7126487.1 metallophosphoesterase family protein [Sporolactobacillus shoreicorticis]